MGAINFIDSNPTTAVIHANEARDMQQAQAAESLFAARDARQQRADMDAAYGAAADEIVAKPKPSALATIAPAQPQGDGMLAPVEPTAQTYSAAQPRVSPLATVTADSGSGNVSALKGMRNTGKVRYEMALAQQAQAKEAQKRADTGMLELMKAIKDDDTDGALLIDKHYNLGQASAISDPNQRTVIRRVIQTLPKNATAEQAVAGTDAGVQEWGRVYKATGNRNEADRAAGAAMAKAIMATPGKADAYFQDDAGNVTAVRGGKATPVEGARGRTTRFAGGGSVNDQSQIRREQWDEKKLQQHIKESADIYTTMGIDGKPVVNSEIRGAYAAMVRTFAPEEADARASAIRQKAEQLASNPETGVVDQEQFDRAYLMGMRAMSNKLRSRPAAPKPAPAQPSATPKPAASPLAQVAPAQAAATATTPSYDELMKAKADMDSLNQIASRMSPGARQVYLDARLPDVKRRIQFNENYRTY